MVTTSLHIRIPAVEPYTTTSPLPAHMDESSPKLPEYRDDSKATTPRSEGTRIARVCGPEYLPSSAPKQSAGGELRVSTHIGKTAISHTLDATTSRRVDEDLRHDRFFSALDRTHSIFNASIKRTEQKKIYTAAIAKKRYSTAFTVALQLLPVKSGRPFTGLIRRIYQTRSLSHLESCLNQIGKSEIKISLIRGLLLHVPDTDVVSRRMLHELAQREIAAIAALSSREFIDPRIRY